jgi:SAM-dependent methyltransferase
MEPVSPWCSVLRRILKSLKRHGLKATLLKFYVAWVDYWFDVRYGTDTCRWMLLHDLNIRSENKERGVRYEPARIVLLRKMFVQIRSLILRGGVVVDLGAGKGRVLLIASEFGFTGARGVEFAPELCTVARHNCEKYRQSKGTTTEFRIVEADVVDYPVGPDENVFVMFNPFDDVVLDKVLDNLVRSLAAHPRRIVIGYYNPEHNDVITRHPGFVRTVEMSTWGYHFTLYSNIN